MGKPGQPTIQIFGSWIYIESGCDRLGRFSDNSPVGNKEWGSTAPLETWIDFMKMHSKIHPKIFRVLGQKD